MMTMEELCELAQQGNMEKRNELILLCLPMLRQEAAATAAVYRSHMAEVDDLLQIGVFAICRCIRSFDPSREKEFISYARMSVRNAMINAARRLSRLPCPPSRLIRLDAPYDISGTDDELLCLEVTADPYQKTPEQIYIEKETATEINTALAALTPRERTYLRFRFGFEDDAYHSLKETASHFSLGEGRAKKLEKDALAHFRGNLPGSQKLIPLPVYLPSDDDGISEINTVSVLSPR